ncbi:hypothetical protein E2C01_007459 [Portunus trituberculatus]|uniref:Uncharacterized protein n=1 Tax=Portunus trituberculatus TaxID=210409 RepID=A0A5B7CZH9_PORTR|nr:hypothetical protein [Portunus trituberculatus]
MSVRGRLSAIKCAISVDRERRPLVPETADITEFYCAQCFTPDITATPFPITHDPLSPCTRPPTAHSHDQQPSALTAAPTIRALY